MTDPKPHIEKGIATLLEIVAVSSSYQAALIRSAPQDETEALRGKAHDLLDAFLDRKSDAARATLDILKG